MARRQAGPWLAAAVLALTGCNIERALQVEDPDVAKPGALNSAAALPALLAGSLADFQVAYSGSNVTFPTSMGINSDFSQVTMVGMLTDELINSETFPTRIEVDQRNIQATNGTMDGVYRALHRARAAAEKTVDKYNEFAPNVIGEAEALSLAGYTYIFFGENYCSGVPFSRLTDAGDLEYGTPKTSAETYQLAIQKFDSAITIATAIAGTATGAALTAANNQRNLARVGKARALLDLNDHVGAAAALAAVAGTPGVPAIATSFNYLVRHSENSARENNGIFSLIQLGRRFSTPNTEGINGQPFLNGPGGVQDPRVRATRGTGNNAFGFDNVTPLFEQQKYTSRAANAVLADGIEARMIEAEAAMRADDGATFIAKLNDPRLTPPAHSGLTAPMALLVDPVTPAAREDMLFRERAFWFYLTSHRLGDLRRLIRQYGRGAETVFPTGTYHKGGTYGTDVNAPVTQDETNNPNFDSCIDRNA